MARPARILAAVGIAVAGIAASVGGVWLANAEYIHGPALEPTPAELSLGATFPKPVTLVPGTSVTGLVRPGPSQYRVSALEYPFDLPLLQQVTELL